MKKFVMAGAVFGLFALTGAGYAANDGMYMGMHDGKSMVMGGGMTEGSEVMMGSGAKPSDCPAGHYYTTDSSQQMVMACDTDAKFMLKAPGTSDMMADGKAYPEGSMMMTPAQ